MVQHTKKALEKIIDGHRLERIALSQNFIGVRVNLEDSSSEAKTRLKKAIKESENIYRNIYSNYKDEKFRVPLPSYLFIFENMELNTDFEILKSDIKLYGFNITCIYDKEKEIFVAYTHSSSIFDIVKEHRRGAFLFRMITLPFYDSDLNYSHLHVIAVSNVLSAEYSTIEPFEGVATFLSENDSTEIYGEIKRLIRSLPDVKIKKGEREHYVW